MSQINTNAILDASGGTTATVNGFAPTMSNMAGRNRIINGDMRIDQRNAGASVTITASTYTLDRWRVAISQASKLSVQQNAGSVTPPAGFINYLGATSLSAYTVGSGEAFSILHRIEGFNCADLGWGTSDAKTVTLSFWVRSSLTGTFGGSFRNNADNRSYPYSYTISSANTWEQKTVTVVGDTTGSWETGNGSGITLFFGLGVGSTLSGTAGAWAGANYISSTGATSVVGTSGATFYITGVQLEEGSVATPFEHRQYGQELALCQRYYYKTDALNSNSRLGSGYGFTTTIGKFLIQFPVPMRAAPSSLEQTGTASDYQILFRGSSATCSAVPTFGWGGSQNGGINATVASGLTAGDGMMVAALNTGAFFGWSAEL